MNNIFPKNIYFRYMPSIFQIHAKHLYVPTVEYHAISRTEGFFFWKLYYSFFHFQIADLGTGCISDFLLMHHI